MLQISFDDRGHSSPIISNKGGTIRDRKNLVISSSTVLWVPMVLSAISKEVDAIENPAI
jgi:hypothetical protein